MLIRAQDRDAAKTQNAPQILAPFDGFRGIFRRGHHDIVCLMEHPVIAGGHSADLPPCHRMGGDVFHIRPKDRLDLIHHVSFNAGHVSNPDTASKQVLIIPDPLDKDLGIESENDRIRL